MFKKWRSKHPRTEDPIWGPIPGTVPVAEPAAETQGLTMPVPPSPTGWTDRLTVEQISLLADQVMWTRDTIRWMLHQVAAHRWDGHDCPVYCVPQILEDYLHRCTADDLRLIMVTLVKDSVHMGPDLTFEDADDET